MVSIPYGCKITLKDILNSLLWVLLIIELFTNNKKNCFRP